MDALFSEQPLQLLISALLIAIAVVLALYIFHNVRRNKFGTGDAVALLGIVATVILGVNQQRAASDGAGGRPSPTPTPFPMQQMIVGSWQFDHFQGGKPPVIQQGPMTVTYTPRVFRFHEDGVFEAAIVVELAGQKIEQQGSGRYTFTEPNKMRVESSTNSDDASSSISTFTVAVENDSLTLRDIGGVGTVFRRSGE